MNTNTLYVRDFCYIAIFTALIAICAQLRIPMPYGVPMTLQTFAIPLAGIVLGARKGTIAALVYILLGAAGAPVFSGFTGGIGSILGPTGGFILSFPVMAFAASIGADTNNKARLIFGLVAGAVINYLCGMLYYALVLSSDIPTAFAACVLPFIPTAILKIVLVTAFGRSLKTVLIKSGVLINSQSGLRPQPKKRAISSSCKKALK